MNVNDLGVRIIVRENLSEVSTFLGHGPASSLAKTDSVPLSHTLNDHLCALLLHGEVVALDRIPSQTPIESEARALIQAAQATCLA